MVVERESVMRGDSDSLDKQQQQQLIIVQAQQTDDGPEEIGRQYSAKPRRLKTTGYYILDLRPGSDVVSTLPRTVQDQGSMSSMVALGSRIYIFGRQINNSDSPKPSSSYFLDLTNSQTSSSSSSFCWKRAHPLTTDKLPLGGAVAFGGKMYFFRDSDDLSCFCEVFDPTQPKPHWRRIKSAPGGAQELTPPVLADHKNNRIIVFFNNISSMYAYYPSLDRWECVVEGFGRWFFYLQPVTLVDGVIYVHLRKLKGFFMAYDIATKVWLNVQVSPAAAVDNYKSYLPLYRYGSLLHLGNGILCLLASTYKDRESDQPQPQPQTQTTLIHVVQFKVELINNNDTKEVLVTPLSTRYYDLDSRCVVYRCLAL